MLLATIFSILAALNPVAVSAEKLVFASFDAIQAHLIRDTSSKTALLCDATAVLVVNLECASVSESTFNTASAKESNDVPSLAIPSLLIFGNTLLSETLIVSSPRSPGFDWVIFPVGLSLSKFLRSVFSVLLFEIEPCFDRVFSEPFLLPFAGCHGTALATATPPPRHSLTPRSATFHYERIT